VLSVYLSVCMGKLGYRWTNFHEIDIWLFSENLSRKFRFNYNLTTITGAYMKTKYTFLIIPRSILLKIRTGKSCAENQNTRFMFKNFFSKIMLFMRQVKIFCRAGQTTDDSMALTHC
jgi:hypothetical protein